jgi:hypothetical protein
LCIKQVDNYSANIPIFGIDNRYPGRLSERII